MSKTEGYTAVITGGNKGIGACLTKRMLDEGFKVISLSRSKPEISHESLIHMELNLADDNAVSTVAKEIAKNHQVTHFIHNAGVGTRKPIDKAKASEIGESSQIHLGSALTLIQAFLPAMKKKKFGRVIFNSARAVLGMATHTAYSASKSGMIGMARTWALELAKHKITVNVVAPGPIQSDSFWESVPKGSDLEKEIAKHVPVGRIGTVDDVTNAFMFFADEKSGFITGQTLYVCGGTSVGTAIL